MCDEHTCLSNRHDCTARGRSRREVKVDLRQDDEDGEEASRGYKNTVDYSQVLQQVLCRESHQELLHVCPFTVAPNSRSVSHVSIHFRVDLDVCL